MSKQFVEPLIAENAKFKEIIEQNKAVILEKILASYFDAETKAKIIAEFTKEESSPTNS